MNRAAIAFLLVLIPSAHAQENHIPPLQAIPLPHDQVSFQRDGKELARLHFAPTQRRPFVFPILGPSGAMLTRMGHPHDPAGHSHHNSVWISHNDVNGITFWGDRGKNAGKIVTERLEKLEDGVLPAAARKAGDTQTAATLVNHWIDPEGKVLIVERRRTAVHPLPKGEWLLLLDLQLEAKQPKTVLGKTPFGLVGVRMAKTIGIADGGGTIRNSEGNVNEKGEKGCFWKKAKWCDYSGQSAPKVIEGITLFDHPSNPNHPTAFHVREDGWMGTCLTFDGPRELEPGTPLRLRYALYVHSGMPSLNAINEVWTRFSNQPLPALTKKK